MISLHISDSMQITLLLAIYLTFATVYAVVMLIGYFTAGIQFINPIKQMKYLYDNDFEIIYFASLASLIVSILSLIGILFFTILSYIE